MCEYCNNVITGDDWNPMLSQVIDVGLFGTADVDCWLSLDDGIPTMEMGICFNDKNPIVKIPIKCCPMCGEELTDEKIFR